MTPPYCPGRCGMKPFSKNIVAMNPISESTPRPEAVMAYGVSLANVFVSLGALRSSWRLEV